MGTLLDRAKAALGEAKPAAVEPGRKASQAGDWFLFAGTPGAEDDAEALEERAGIIAEGCGISQAAALLEARQQIERQRCWQRFIHNARTVLDAPVEAQAGLLSLYRAEAVRRYGKAGATMADELAGWVKARRVH